MRTTLARTAAVGTVVIIADLTAAAVFAPYVHAELMPWLASYTTVDPAPAKIAKGIIVVRRLANARRHDIAGVDYPRFASDHRVSP
jgi:hypothetical protein